MSLFSTYADALAWARRELSASGADSPWLTALLLLEHVSGLSRVQLIAHGDARLAPADGTAYREMVERRCRREPLAYILGSREFFGRAFAVDCGTLVPRPETERVVELAAERLLRTQSQTASLLDVGTGSGAIVISLLATEPRCRAVATDTSLSALRMARINARTHDVGDRLRLVAGDLASPIRGRFDVVVANLPYLPSEEIASLDPEVATWEPRAALDGGPDGMRLIARVLRQLADLLTDDGAAYLEHGHDQARAVRGLAHEALPDASIRTERDAAGVDRYLVVERGSAR